ncbi:MAG TPA: hypothetical protein VFT87_00080 [Candidatus Saccharimonadales bacterium]|nr:hypothetical protein [Candidatus Saccharimonadales bacterium]
MNPINLPQYLIDLERLHRNVQFGEAGPFKLKKANGKVVKLATKVMDSLRFRSNDEVLLYLADKVRSLPDNREGKVTFIVDFKNTKAMKVETITEEEIDYTMEAV